MSGLQSFVEEGDEDMERGSDAWDQSLDLRADTRDSLGRDTRLSSVTEVRDSAQGVRVRPDLEALECEMVGEGRRDGLADVLDRESLCLGFNSRGIGGQAFRGLSKCRGLRGRIAGLFGGGGPALDERDE